MAAAKGGTGLFNRLTATIADLSELLKSGQLKSVHLVESYLNQIEKHNDALKAVIATTPRSRLEALARALDEERAAGSVRGPLHGIPLLVKDNFATPSLETDTTAGSYALVGSKPARDAKVITKLIEAGAIIIGKGNLSEFSYWKGSGLLCGWSALGGQTQSAYVRGGLVHDGSLAGHSNPGGSSSGPGVAVSAGFAPAAIGTETDGSLVMPSTRAALYTMKPTIGIVSRDGIVPCSPLSDNAGPMVKSPYDLALLLDILVDPETTNVPKGGYTSVLVDNWSGLRIGTLDPTSWKFPPRLTTPDEGATEQMHSEIRAAYDKIAESAKLVHENVPLITPAQTAEEDKGTWGLYDVFHAQFKGVINEYLESLEESKVRSLEELVEYHKNIASKELPPDYPNQDILEKDISFKLGDDDVSEVAEMVRARGRRRVNEILDQFNLDAIVGPADSPMTTLASAAGYPIATLPLGYLKLNGRPFGLTALAAGHAEATLLKVQSAWEATFPKRQPPPLLEAHEKV